MSQKIERNPACASLTYESDVARAFRQAREARTFEEWFEIICDDIPMGGKLTGAELKTIADFCWTHGFWAGQRSATIRSSALAVQIEDECDADD